MKALKGDLKTGNETEFGNVLFKNQLIFDLKELDALEESRPLCVEETKKRVQLQVELEKSLMEELICSRNLEHYGCRKVTRILKFSNG